MAVAGTAEATFLGAASDALTEAIALVIRAHDEELAKDVVPELDRVRSRLFRQKELELRRAAHSPRNVI